MEGGVRKKGNRWYYYFEAGRVNGKRKRIERKGGDTKKEAQQALRMALNEFNNTGSYVNETNMSFSDFLDYWFDEYVMKNCKYNTQQTYKSFININLKPNLGIYKIKQLNYAALQEFLNKQYAHGYSKNTLARLRSIISHSLEMAVSPYQFIKVNPAKNLTLPRFDNIAKKNIVISIENFNKIIGRFPCGTSFYIPLQIAFNTGMRAGEVCGLTWDCVDFEKKTIRIEKILIFKTKQGYEFSTPKTKGSIRTISIGDTLINILKTHKNWQEENKKNYGSYYNDNNFVCTKENGSFVTMTSLRYLSRIINMELQIKFNFHSLRHTHATMLLEGGANIKDIQDRLGHSKFSTTMDLYSHVTAKMQNSTVNILENILNQEAKLPPN
ncbi:site-specific integrase [Clostridium botulinum]|nr:site-specific integrase [Clostridium botulinum]